MAVVAWVRHRQSTVAIASNAVHGRPLPKRWSRNSALMRSVELEGMVMPWKERSKGSSYLDIASRDRGLATMDGGRMIGSESSHLTEEMDGDGIPTASSPAACKNWAISAPSATLWFHVTPTTKPPRENWVTCISSRGSVGPQCEHPEVRGSWATN